MGRGQVSAHDQFSKVLGSRRGSALAQRQRDREESLALIDGPLAVENLLDPINILPIAPLLRSGDQELDDRMADAILANIRHNSLRTLVMSLQAPHQEVPASLKHLLRRSAAEYIASDRHTDPAIKREYVFSFSETMFATTPFRPLAQVRADVPIIKAIARYCERERRECDREDEDSRDAQAQIFQFLANDLFSLPPDYLPLFAPWHKFLIRAIRKRTYSPALLKEFVESQEFTATVSRDESLDHLWEVLNLYGKGKIALDEGKFRMNIHGELVDRKVLSS